MVSCLPPFFVWTQLNFWFPEAPAPRDGKMDIKMINVGRKGEYCLIIMKNMLGLLDPNKLLMLVLRNQQQWLEVLQRSLVRQGQVNLLQKKKPKRRGVFCP